MKALQKYQYLNRKPHFDFFKDRVQINQIKILREYKKKYRISANTFRGNYSFLRLKYVPYFLI